MNAHHSNRPAARAAEATLSIAEIVLVLIVLVALTAAVIVGGATATPEVSTTMRIKVHAGDSWWTLAQQYPVEGLSTSQLADHLARANDVDADELVAGSTVSVPAPTRPAGIVAMLTSEPESLTQ